MLARLWTRCAFEVHNGCEYCAGLQAPTLERRRVSRSQFEVLTQRSLGAVWHEKNATCYWRRANYSPDTQSFGGEAA